MAMSEYEYEIETDDGTLRTNDVDLAIIVMVNSGMIAPPTESEYKLLVGGGEKRRPNARIVDPRGVVYDE